jgi:hypothetical protein
MVGRRRLFVAKAVQIALVTMATADTENWFTFYTNVLLTYSGYVMVFTGLLCV